MNMKSRGAMLIEANRSKQPVVDVETLEMDGYSKKESLAWRPFAVLALAFYLVVLLWLAMKVGPFSFHDGRPLHDFATILTIMIHFSAYAFGIQMIFTRLGMFGYVDLIFAAFSMTIGLAIASAHFYLEDCVFSRALTIESGRVPSPGPFQIYASELSTAIRSIEVLAPEMMRYRDTKACQSPWTTR